MHRSTYSLSILLTLLLLSTHVFASTETMSSFTDTFCDPGKTAGSNLAFAGKPISLVSGMETFSPSIDLTFGNLYPIRVTRSYNSRTTYDSPLGYGWAINYDKRLYTYPDGSITVRQDCGGKKRFKWSGPGYTSTDDTAGLLMENNDGSYTYIDKYGETEKYDIQGRLVSLVDEKGNRIVFFYRAQSRDFLWGLLYANLDQNNPVIVAYDYHLSRIEEQNAAGDPTGAAVDLQYDYSTGRLISLIDSIGRTVSYTHDAYGNLTSASGPGVNSAYSYTNATKNHLLTTIDEGKGVYVNTYDATGKVITQTHGTGVMTFEYTIPYQKTTTTTLINDSNGNLLNTQTRIAEFDANRMLKRSTDTNGNITTYVRDSNYRILQKGLQDIITNITVTTAYTYDAKGNTLTKTEAQGTPIEKTTTYTYDPIYGKVLTETVKSVVDPNQNKGTTSTYDSANGNLLTTTETGLLGDSTPYSYTTTYTYDANGKVTSIDGPRTDVQDVTTFTYDTHNGNILSMTQPIIGTTSFSNHDLLGNPQTITDPNGNTTTYTYDTIGRVTSVKAPGDTASTQYAYVSGGVNKIDHITLPQGNRIDFGYDANGNLSMIRDSLNNTINYTYDSEGNKLTEQIKDSSGSLQKYLNYQYDSLNRLSKIVNPDNNYTQYRYDGRNNRISLRTPNAQLTTYAYDALNRLGSTLQPLHVLTSYTYNSNNNLTSVKDANSNTTTYRYDDRGRVYQVISPDTGTTTYSYDPAGNMVSKTDAKGITIVYGYDALSRLTKIDFPTDTDTVYAYDNCVNGKGRLCSMLDTSGTTAYEYTPKAQIKKETKVIDGISYVTQYTYDQNSNLKTMTYPSGRIVSYNYSNDRAVSVLNGAVSIATNINYKPFGGMSAITYGNGIVGTIGYDNQYRVASITAAGVMNLTYAGDANGNITAIANAIDATKNISFGYDTLDRLSIATASGVWGSLGWTYDGVGNRLTENSSSYTYTAGTNKLSSANGQSYGFDNNGNTTAEGARVFTYNQNQRLIRVVDAGVTKGEYIYNGGGQRVRKVVSGTTSIFHYSRSGQIIAESDSAGTITVEYVYLNGHPLVQIERTNICYYHNDHLGTPQKMTGSSGSVVWSADYKPFGETTIIVSTITNNLRFPGQYFDAAIGLNYNYFRDYNPVIGRYLENDRVGMKGGINLYRYAVSNPIRYVDTLGLWSSKGHTSLTRRILLWHLDSFSEYDMSIIVQSNIETDYGLSNQLNNSLHFMPGKGEPAFQNINDLIETAINSSNHDYAMRSLVPLCTSHRIDMHTTRRMQAGWHIYL